MTLDETTVIRLWASYVTVTATCYVAGVAVFSETLMHAVKIFASTCKHEGFLWVRDSAGICMKCVGEIHDLFVVARGTHAYAIRSASSR